MFVTRIEGGLVMALVAGVTPGGTGTGVGPFTSHAAVAQQKLAWNTELDLWKSKASAAHAKYDQAVARVVTEARALGRAKTPAGKAQAETNLYHAVALADAARADADLADAELAWVKAKALEAEKAKSKDEPKR